jgi:hypothetical protein
MSSRFKNKFGDQYVIEGLLKADSGWQGSIAWIIHGPQTGLVRHTAPVTIPDLYGSKEAAEEACREFANKNRPE